MAPYGPGSDVVLESYRAAIREGRAQAEALSARTAQATGVDSRLLVVHADRVLVDCASHFRSADAVIVGRPNTKDIDFSDEHVFEAALFHSGRPTLILPDTVAGPIGDDIAIAWKDCREAARAVNDALPLLVNAKRVRLIAVRGAEDESFFGQPAMERMVSLLVAHGAPVVAQAVQAGRDGAGAALLDAARGADLLVMGAYGHWRMAEMLFGGMTRQLLHEAPLPLFMSR
jgi:nucleotide-binding universal stress UspA family protein